MAMAASFGLVRGRFEHLRTTAMPPPSDRRALKCRGAGFELGHGQKSQSKKTFDCARSCVLGSNVWFTLIVFYAQF